MTAVFVAIFGGLGAVVRLLVDGTARRFVGHLVPWQTSVINGAGSLIAGLVAGMATSTTTFGPVDPTTWQTVALVGFCGGFTTMSSAAADTVALLHRRRHLQAAAYAVGTAIAAVLACMAGWLLGASLV